VVVIHIGVGYAGHQCGSFSWLQAEWAREKTRESEQERKLYHGGKGTCPESYPS